MAVAFLYKRHEHYGKREQPIKRTYLYLNFFIARILEDYMQKTLSETSSVTSLSEMAKVRSPNKLQININHMTG